MRFATPVFRLLLAGVAMSAYACSAQALDLTVEVLNARSDQGSVNGALFADEATWLKTPIQGDRAAAGPKVVLVYRGLPPGRYAVSVFHDENANGRLDANVAGVPTERFGFSRDARGSLAAPKFDDAAIELQQDATITVHLR